MRRTTGVGASAIRMSVAVTPAVAGVTAHAELVEREIDDTLSEIELTVPDTRR